MRRRFSSGRQSSVRMLCSRSASLIDDDARILRDREQQLAVVLDLPLLARPRTRCFAIFVTPSTIPAISFPNSSATSATVTAVSSTTSWISPLATVLESRLQLGQDLRDLDAVVMIRVAGRPLLPVVRLFAELIGAHEELRVESLEAGITEIQLGENQFERRSRQFRPVLTVSPALKLYTTRTQWVADTRLRQLFVQLLTP